MSYKPPSSRRMRRSRRQTKTVAVPVPVPVVEVPVVEEVVPAPEPEPEPEPVVEVPEPVVEVPEPEPEVLVWSSKSTKAVLLEVAAAGGLTELSDENTKAEIVAALEAAGL